jgi:sugar phosphate isomerase/epimerase
MIPMFGYQLYSSRNFPPLSDTLAMLARAGYTFVEGYGGLYDDAAGLAAMLKANHLKMLTGHFAMDMLEHEVSHALTIATTLGMERIYCPYLVAADRPSDAKGWHALGARLDKIGKPYRDAGFGFGWHNHDFEFVALPDGTIPQDAMFDGGPDLEWEMDVAWVIRGGADPLKWITKYGKRITSAHVKDIAPPGQNTDEDGWSDVGHGTVDWKGLIAALRGVGCKHFIMEHDNPSDHHRFATRSLASAKTY